MTDELLISKGQADFIARSPECYSELEVMLAKTIMAQDNYVGSKNALDAIIKFIKSESNPTLEDYKSVSAKLFADNCQSLSSHVIEYITHIGEELYDFRQTASFADDRNEFEAWYRGYCGLTGEDLESEFERKANGDYVYSGAADAWDMWKSCRSAKTPDKVTAEDFRRMLKQADHDWNASLADAIDGKQS